MIININIMGGGALYLEGIEAQELFEILKGYAEEEDLLTPGCSTSINPIQRIVKSPDETRITL